MPSCDDILVVDYYHELLYSYAGAKWQTDKDFAHQVYFDPISPEDFAPITEEISESLAPATTYVSFMHMQASHTNYQGQRFVGMAMFYVLNAKAKNETNSLRQEPIERDWMLW